MKSKWTNENIPKPDPQITAGLNKFTSQLGMAYTLANILAHIVNNPELPTDKFYLDQIKEALARWDELDRIQLTFGTGPLL